MGQAIIGGVIGAICSLIAIWVVFQFIEFNIPNVYIAVAIAGFFSAFFAKTCTSICSKND